MAAFRTNSRLPSVGTTVEVDPSGADAQENKFYAKGVGMIKEVDLETGDELLLIEFEKPNTR